VLAEPPATWGGALPVGSTTGAWKLNYHWLPIAVFVPEAMEPCSQCLRYWLNGWLNGEAEAFSCAALLKFPLFHLNVITK